ncbi:MAG: universal stress protein [Chitinophagaceae bacterium]|nr:universal stress protein [Chitinophagaceae bacterium]
MKKILVPTDFSLNANKALDYAVQLCKHFEAELYIIHAVELPDTSIGDRTGTSAEYNRKIRQEAEEQLALLKTSITETEKIKAFTGLYNADVTSAIKEAVRSKKIDWVVMGTLGRSGIKEHIFGSKTASFVPHSEVPVLVIPPEGEWQGIDNILLAVNDFNSIAQTAGTVFETAGTFKALVHVASFSDNDLGGLMVSLVQEWELIRCRQEVESAFPDVTINTISLKGDSLKVALEEYIEEANIDMLVMVTHKRSFLASVFKPSVTKKMTYHTKIPLLAIPANSER